MISSVFTYTVSEGAPMESFHNMSTIGTPLEGLQEGVPLVVTSTVDILAEETDVGGVNVIGVRAVADDTLRFISRGLRGRTVSVLVTDLSR